MLNARAKIQLGLVVCLQMAVANVSAESSLGAHDKVIKNSFVAKNVATLDRLEQDELNRICSETRNQPDPKTAVRLQDAQFKRVKFPSDDNYFGDWRKGEKIAQSGKGMTWRDKVGSNKANGGSCYNCHQIGPDELSYGTIGTSLYNYGKIRGTSKEMVKYTWAKIYNAKAFSACSQMPRAGGNILTDDQIRHLMALLLDPDSPVNR